MLYLMKFDLLTGVFTLVPLAWLDKRPGITFGQIMRNWVCRWLIGCSVANMHAFKDSFNPESSGIQAGARKTD